MHEPSFAGTDGETVISWWGVPPSLPQRRTRGTTLGNPPRSGRPRTIAETAVVPGEHTRTGAPWLVRRQGVFSLAESPRLTWPMGVMAESDKISGMPTGAEDAR